MQKLLLLPNYADLGEIRKKTIPRLRVANDAKGFGEEDAVQQGLLAVDRKRQNGQLPTTEAAIAYCATVAQRWINKQHRRRSPEVPLDDHHDIACTPSFRSSLSDALLSLGFDAEALRLEPELLRLLRVVWKDDGTRATNRELARRCGLPESTFRAAMARVRQFRK